MDRLVTDKPVKNRRIRQLIMWCLLLVVMAVITVVSSGCPVGGCDIVYQDGVRWQRCCEYVDGATVCQWTRLGK